MQRSWWWMGVCLVVGLGIPASGAVAQSSYNSSSSDRSSSSPVKFGIGGGLAIPISHFKDQNKLGWQGQAFVRFRPGRSPVGFQVDGNYMQLPYSDSFVRITGPGKRQIISGTADIVFAIPTSDETRFKPYILGGAGIYYVKNNNDTGRDPHVTKFGLNGGVGFDVGAGPVVFFAEGRFHNLFTGTLDDIGSTSDLSLIPVTVGIKFGGQ
ncbi:MAG TPA: outer membrane beta-barrel protein [Gemmatimonadales bacterium]|nr:outer membrane beta-barrel protein [Gemmatimonadales bacterium]